MEESRLKHCNQLSQIGGSSKYQLPTVGGNLRQIPPIGGKWWLAKNNKFFFLFNNFFC